MQRFSKTRRLLTKKEFDEVFAQAKKIVTAEFVVLYRPNLVGWARLGLALSKKKIHKACQRNRLKRLLRESFRLQLLPSLDIIILARQGADSAESRLISANLSNAWEKLIAFYAD